MELVGGFFFWRFWISQRVGILQPNASVRQDARTNAWGRTGMKNRIGGILV